MRKIVIDFVNVHWTPHVSSTKMLIKPIELSIHDRENLTHDSVRCQSFYIDWTQIFGNLHRSITKIHEYVEVMTHYPIQSEEEHVAGGTIASFLTKVGKQDAR